MKRADVVVVGSGLAGLLCALELAPARVVLLTRGGLGDTAASAWAQGGVAAAVGADDSPELHAQDTVAAGAGLVDEALALAIAREAPGVLGRMTGLGARFDREPDGAFATGREAAHSRRRIVHADGDRTGRELLRAATEAARVAADLQIVEGATLLDVVLARGSVAGVRFALAGSVETLAAPRVVLATGGLGAIFRYTTNPVEQWGSGLAIAARAGALLTDLEFVQFHPTALDVALDPLPLVSEAVRGDGARLVDARGAPIVTPGEPRGELAPRDIVARAVFRAMHQGRRAFLDARTSAGRAFPERFPGIFEVAQRFGIDPREQLLPVVAAAHYHMGGIAVDAAGRTSVPGLWACGEAAGTGLHGANRLASNSLLEAMVFAERVARDVGASSPSPRVAHLPDDGTNFAFAPADPAAAARIRERMFADVGIERNERDLRAAVEAFTGERERVRAHVPREMALVGLLLARAALQRRESRGGHFRSDYPGVSETAAHSFLYLDDEREVRIPA